jgi:hypothetical protein
MPADLVGLPGFTDPFERVVANLHAVMEQIEIATHKAGRESQSVRLVVVTKGHSVEMAQLAQQAGAKHLGENYVEEAIPKIQQLVGHGKLTWHMIGHIQSRKAQLVSEHFDWVHSLDSLKLARRLNMYAGLVGRQLQVLLECNVSGESSKFGFPAWEDDSWEKICIEFAGILTLPNLKVRGLMTIAPFFDEDEYARPYFSRLRSLKDFLKLNLPGSDWDQLSMGMSGDFKVAIEEGATIVRIGTAILGHRP